MNSNSAPSGVKYAEDWLPIKSINNGMILTEDGYYVTGVKVSPKNIFILDEQSQNAILFNLSTFYNTLDFDFWLLVSDRPVDISLYLNELQVEYNKNPNSAIRKLIMQDINKANLFMSRDYNVVDTEYYILFREKKADLIQKRIRTLMNGLATCNLNAMQTTNEDLRTLIENFVNGGMRTEFGVVMPV